MVSYTFKIWIDTKKHSSKKMYRRQRSANACNNNFYNLCVFICNFHCNGWGLRALRETLQLWQNIQGDAVFFKTMQVSTIRCPLFAVQVSTVCGLSVHYQVSTVCGLGVRCLRFKFPFSGVHGLRFRCPLFAVFIISSVFGEGFRRKNCCEGEIPPQKCRCEGELKRKVLSRLVFQLLQSPKNLRPGRVLDVKTFQT